MPRPDALAGTEDGLEDPPERSPPRPTITSIKFRSSVGALTGVAHDSPGRGGAAQSAEQGAATQSLLRWACVLLAHSCAFAGLCLGTEHLYFSAGAQGAQDECDTQFVAGSRMLVHEFIGWAPVWGRNALLVTGLLAVCRAAADLERRPGIVQGLLLGVGKQDGRAPSAGWHAIVVGSEGGTALQRQPQFEQVRLERGMSPRQALVVASSKLALWHWSQPCAYLWLLWVYRCYVFDLGPMQQHLAAVVAARESLYLLSTLLATWHCPVYLLLDLRTVWNEEASKLQRFLRLAMYILTPHNFVALSLARRFPTLRDMFLGMGAVQVLADLSSCFALAALLANTLEARAGIVEDVVPLIVGALLVQGLASRVCTC